MSDSLTRLGVRPVYPLSETMRLGTIVVADAAVALPNSGLPPFQETSLLVTEDLVPTFDQARRDRYTAQASRRFPQSSGDLVTALRPGTTGAAFYRQVPPKSEQGSAPDGSLTLAAMPGFTLASVDQLSAGAFVPDLVASVFASLGLRRTSYLRMEAEGVEVAELPLSDLRHALRAACSQPAVLARRDRYENAVTYAYEVFDAQRRQRASSGGPTAPPRLILVMPRRVFYLRGVRFIVDDSRAAAAFAQAAIRQPPLPAGASPLSLPTVTINNTPTPVAGAAAPAAGSAAAANNQRIADLQQQLEQLRAAMATGGSIQLGGSFARATATGVELVQLFDRPLAFGYQAIQRRAVLTADPAKPDRVTGSTGIAPICATVDSEEE